MSELSLHAPPWWLISCAALELWSDRPAHQTPLSLTATPLIAQCFIIVSHSVLACGFLPPYLHVREFTAYLTVFVAFQNDHISTSRTAAVFAQATMCHLCSKLYSGAQRTGKHGMIIGAS